MNKFDSLSDWQNFRSRLKGSLGFVPTMGALHDGHLSLIKQSLSDNKYTLASIYINPTQFNDTNDLKNYPQQMDKDIKILQEIGCDFVLTPTYEQIYPDNFNYKVSEQNLSKLFCGRSRPGHFDGVLTIVLKLLNIVQPTKVYFGKKDFQQYLLVKNMVEAFFIPTQVIGCENIRETDGLAMSSRNFKLCPEKRKTASLFYKILKDSKNPEEAIAQLKKENFKVDYVEDCWGRRLGAVYLDNVRLIDNIKLGELI